MVWLVELGGGVLAPPWAASYGNLYVRGLDNQLYAHSLSGGGWAGPFFFTTSGPVATPDATGTSVFFREGDGSLGQQHFVGLGTDRPEDPIGGFLTAGPSAISAPGGLMSVYVRGGDGGLYRRHFNGSSWGGWESFGGFLVTGAGPTSVTDGAGSIEHTFVLGGDFALYTIAVDATAAGLSTTELGGRGDAPPRGDGHARVDEYGIIRSG